MRFTTEVASRVKAALQARLGEDPKCSLCGKVSWAIHPGYVFLNLHEQTFPLLRSSAKQELPCIAITCVNCGNTHLMNVVQLGLGELLKD